MRSARFGGLGYYITLCCGFLLVIVFVVYWFLSSDWLLGIVNNKIYRDLVLYYKLYIFRDCRLYILYIDIKY